MRLLFVSVFVIAVLSAFADVSSPAGLEDVNLALAPEERKAMEFLYSNMSDPDKAGYSPEFYLQNVRASLRAREEMPWGRRVPEREFLHFVLPLRVNNESLDMSRPVFYDELKERVKDMDMADAILEVNHWCHEKVTYRPSDARTSSPLSSVSQAIGRCGEESTFTVAALRSVGIPARQVYTPRWAHTDDNHAWVEAWADGKWHFIGACEPEPVLDKAWFNAPASRGMLMSTNVFGAYDGPEEQLLQNDIVTTVNVTSNYAPTRKIGVVVRDREKRPVKDATVRFCIYNYAEFYPVAIRRTDDSGIAELTAGKGDMIVWASDGVNYGFGQSKGGDTEPLEIVLDKNDGFCGECRFDITPPPVRSVEVPVDEALVHANSLRLAKEDSLRAAYMSTFATPESAASIATELGLDKDRLARVLVESRGNHDAIAGVLRGLSPENRITALHLLEKVSEKDRRDIPAEVIVGHVESFVADSQWPLDFQCEYVLNPRVENERLTNYKRQLFAFIPESLHSGFIDNPEKLADWVDMTIEDDSRRNPLNLRMDPPAVAAMRMATPLSKRIFFVAAARSLGIPARLDPVRGVAQYAGRDLEWHDVLAADMKQPDATVSKKGKLKLPFQPQKYLIDPKYYTHFTISRIKDGIPTLLEYPEDGTVSQLFASPSEMDAGHYMLVTGQRLADGGVLAFVRFFDVRAGETTELPLTVREDDTAVTVIGSLNAEDIYHDSSTDTDRSILSTTGRGYYVLGIIRNGHEPSVHALNDISLVGGEFSRRSEKLGGGEKILLLFEGDDADFFDRSDYPDLPSNVVIGSDPDGVILNEIRESLNLTGSELPVFVVADSFNRIVFVSQGYSIGLGDRLLRILESVDKID